MNEKNKELFRLDCTKYLLSKCVIEVRAYARSIGVFQPTTKIKDILVKEAVEILLGERKAVPPAKNPSSQARQVSACVGEGVAELWNKYFAQEQKEETEDILSTLTDSQKEDLNATLRFLKFLSKTQ